MEKYSDKLRILAKMLDEDFKKNRKKVISELFHLLSQIIIND